MKWMCWGKTHPPYMEALIKRQEGRTRCPILPEGALEIRGLGQRFGKPDETLAFPPSFLYKATERAIASHALFYQSVGQ